MAKNRLSLFLLSLLLLSSPAVYADDEPSDPEMNVALDKPADTVNNAATAMADAQGKPGETMFRDYYVPAILANAKVDLKANPVQYDLSKSPVIIFGMVSVQGTYQLNAYRLISAYLDEKGQNSKLGNAPAQGEDKRIPIGAAAEMDAVFSHNPGLREKLAAALKEFEQDDDQARDKSYAFSNSLNLEQRTEDRKSLMLSYGKDLIGVSGAKISKEEISGLRNIAMSDDGTPTVEENNSLKINEGIYVMFVRQKDGTYAVPKVKCPPGQIDYGDGKGCVALAEKPKFSYKNVLDICTCRKNSPTSQDIYCAYPDAKPYLYYLKDGITTIDNYYVAKIETMSQVMFGSEDQIEDKTQAARAFITPTPSSGIIPTSSKGVSELTPVNHADYPDSPYRGNSPWRYMETTEPLRYASLDRCKSNLTNRIAGNYNTAANQSQAVNDLETLLEFTSKHPELKTTDDLIQWIRGHQAE